MSDDKEWDLLLNKLEQIDTNHRDVSLKLDKIVDKQTKHGETLVRNTVTLEEHVKGSIASNKRLEIVEKKLDHVETHVGKVELLIDLLRPTKKKIKILILALSLCGGSYGTYDELTSPKIIPAIIKILNSEND